MTELQDGLHLGLDFASYLKQPRIGKSTLMAHRRTPAHALQDMLTVKEQTAAMRLGSMVHTLVLEPSEWNLRYAVGPDAARNTKVWKEWADAQPEGRELIKPDEFETAQNMASFVDRYKTIARLVQGAGPVEASCLWAWRDAITGQEIALRGRPDKLRPDLHLLIDLKTTADLSDRAIQRKIHDMGYHLQMQLYLEGLEAVGEDYRNAAIVFIESNPPYEARAVLLGDSWMEAARAELSVLKARHAACLVDNDWPGYRDLLDDIEAPAWLVNPMEVAA